MPLGVQPLCWKLLPPTWPDLGDILSLANNTHRRMKLNGTWDSWVRRSSAHILELPDGYSCWNCGGRHWLRDCPKPRDEARIERARQQNRTSTPAQRPQRFRGKPRHKTSSDGKPLILNKNGFYVLDQKRWRSTRTQRPGTTQPRAQANHASHADPSHQDIGATQASAARTGMLPARTGMSHANAVRSALASGQLS